MAVTEKFVLIVRKPGLTSDDVYRDHEWSFQVKENGTLRVEVGNGEILYYAPGSWTRAEKKLVR